MVYVTMSFSLAVQITTCPILVNSMNASILSKLTTRNMMPNKMWYSSGRSTYKSFRHALPPTGPNSFASTYMLVEKRPRRRLVTPTEGWRQPTKNPGSAPMVPLPSNVYVYALCE